MAAPKDLFNRRGYVLLEGMLPLERCAALVQHIVRLEREGRMAADDQCPRSRAIYGDPEFDRVLLDIAQPLAATLERALLPTYSYARIYLPGETLRRHIDRPACEISATMTLGFDAARVWPIYFAKDRFDFLGAPVDIPVGGMAVYKGCEMPHWRQAFDGKWQAQVFLHYVDAAGPHVAEHLDHRPALGMDSSMRSNAR